MQWQLIQERLLKYISYLAAAASLGEFVLAIIVAVRWWLFGVRASDDIMIVAMIGIIVLLLPLGFSLRDVENWDFQPIIKPGRTLAILVRLLAFGLLTALVIRFVAAFNAPKPQRDDRLAYAVMVPLVLFFSYYCFVSYMFGLAVIFGETILATSRNPYLLFNRNALRRYLRYKKKKNDEHHYGGSTERDQDRKGGGPT
jgi:hypothetical protein